MSFEGLAIGGGGEIDQSFSTLLLPSVTSKSRQMSIKVAKIIISLEKLKILTTL